MRRIWALVGNETVSGAALASRRLDVGHVALAFASYISGIRLSDLRRPGSATKSPENSDV